MLHIFKIYQQRSQSSQNPMKQDEKYTTGKTMIKIKTKCLCLAFAIIISVSSRDFYVTFWYLTIVTSCTSHSTQPVFRLHLAKNNVSSILFAFSFLSSHCLLLVYKLSHFLSPINITGLVLPTSLCLLFFGY